MVLLDIGDRLTGEIRWQSGRDGEVVSLLDADAPFLRDSGNRAVSVAFERIEEGGTHAALLKSVMTRLISHGDMDKKPLLIEAAGVAEAQWLASACLCPQMEPGVRVTGRSGLATRYSLTFAGIEEVDTLEDALILEDDAPADPGTLTDDAGAASPSDPGSLQAGASAASPGNPGNLLTVIILMASMVITGTLYAGARQTLPYLGLDGNGNPVWGLGTDDTVTGYQRLYWGGASPPNLQMDYREGAELIHWTSANTTLEATPSPTGANWAGGNIGGGFGGSRR